MASRSRKTSVPFKNLAVKSDAMRRLSEQRVNFRPEMLQMWHKTLNPLAEEDEADTASSYRPTPRRSLIEEDKPDSYKEPEQQVSPKEGTVTFGVAAAKSNSPTPIKEEAIKEEEILEVKETEIDTKEVTLEKIDETKSQSSDNESEFQNISETDSHYNKAFEDENEKPPDVNVRELYSAPPMKKKSTAQHLQQQNGTVLQIDEDEELNNQNAAIVAGAIGTAAVISRNTTKEKDQLPEDNFTSIALQGETNGYVYEVDDDDEEDEEDEDNCCKHKGIICFVLIFVLLVAGGVTAGVLVGVRGGDSEDITTPVPTPVPTIDITQETGTATESIITQSSASTVTLTVDDSADSTPITMEATEPPDPTQTTIDTLGTSEMLTTDPEATTADEVTTIPEMTTCIDTTIAEATTDVETTEPLTTIEPTTTPPCYIGNECAEEYVNDLCKIDFAIECTEAGLRLPHPQENTKYYTCESTSGPAQLDHCARNVNDWATFFNEEGQPNPCVNGRLAPACAGLISVTCECAIEFVNSTGDLRTDYFCFERSIEDGGPYTNLPDPSKCYGYYNCATGMYEECQRTLLFDPAKQECVTITSDFRRCWTNNMTNPFELQYD